MFRDNKGMTLIEVLIALMLLMITFMALIQSSLLALNTNVINELRDAAVSVAEQRMNELRNTPFPVSPATNDLTATPGVVEAAITRNVRAITNFPFTPTRRVTDIAGTDCKQVTLTIDWSYKGKAYQHSVSTVLRKQ